MITSVMMEMPGSDEWFMRQAMKESRKALVKGEVPVGAIVVKDGRVIGRGWNQVETLKDATAHAEMIALTAAQEALGDWRLEGCTLYVPPLRLCGDNGAMIGAQGYYEYLAGRRGGLDLNAYATMDLDEKE